MSADHELLVSIDRGWSSLTLRCGHDLNAMPWCGDYDEYGTLLNDIPTGTCWAAEWVGEIGVDDCLGEGWDGHTYDMPRNVKVYFNGDGAVIEPEPSS